MIRINKNVNLVDALDYILNGNDSIFKTSDNSDDELDDTNFYNAEPQPINDINKEIEIANSCMVSDSTESDGDIPEHPAIPCHYLS